MPVDPEVMALKLEDSRWLAELLEHLLHVFVRLASEARVRFSTPHVRA